MKYISWVITIPFTVLALLFVISNKTYVSVNYWFDKPPYDVPLYAVGLGMLGIGFLGGALFVSFSYYALRHEYWKTKLKLNRLEKQLEEQKQTDLEKDDGETRGTVDGQSSLLIAKSY